MPSERSPAKAFVGRRNAASLCRRHRSSSFITVGCSNPERLRACSARRIQHSDKVLDVGCTTGYSTAVLARIADKTIGLEEDADFVRIASETLRALGVNRARPLYRDRWRKGLSVGGAL